MPKPYLNREEANEGLVELGFHLPFTKGDGQVKKFTALQELLAGAIADWAEPEPEPGDDLVAELQEWTEEWLVG